MTSLAWGTQQDANEFITMFLEHTHDVSAKALFLTSGGRAQHFLVLHIVCHSLLGFYIVVIAS